MGRPLSVVQCGSRPWHIPRHTGCCQEGQQRHLRRLLWSYAEAVAEGGASSEFPGWSSQVAFSQHGTPRSTANVNGIM